VQIGSSTKRPGRSGGFDWSKYANNDGGQAHRSGANGSGAIVTEEGAADLLRCCLASMVLVSAKEGAAFY